MIIIMIYTKRDNCDYADNYDVRNQDAYDDDYVDDMNML